MAMNLTQRNAATEFTNLVVDVLRLKARLTTAVPIYDMQAMSDLLVADYEAFPEFVGIIPDDMYWAKAAFAAIVATIGEYSDPNSNAVKMLKIARIIP